MLKTRYHWIGSNALILKYISFFLSVYCLLDTHTDHSLNSALVYNFLAIKMLICHNLMLTHFDNEVHMLSCQYKLSLIFPKIVVFAVRENVLSEQKNIEKELELAQEPKARP